MSHHRVLSLVICGAGLSAVCGPALAQDSQWGEQPGDIVVGRHVPRQNAVLVGEPGRPTLVNPKTIVGELGFSVGPGLFTEPLSDLEAEAVRATRSLKTDPLNGALDVLGAQDAAGAAFAGSQAMSQERTGFMGGTVSGAMDGATRQIQGVLASALGGGRQ